MVKHRNNAKFLEFGAEKHRGLYAEFCRLEVASGGPDSNIEIIVKASANEDNQVAAWLAGCQVVPWVVSSAAALWRKYPSADVALLAELEEPGSVAEWMVENKDGLLARRDRRAVWNRRKMAECLLSYGKWMKEELPKVYDASYEELWKSAESNIKYFGRYATIKVLEILWRQKVVRAAVPDIRPRGAWSPRLTLSWLYPEHENVLNNGGNKDEALHVSHYLADESRKDVEQRVGLKLNWYQQEVLLCNYRQALEWRHPGRSHDTELAYWLKSESYWGSELNDTLAFRDIRRELFSPAFLGELQGWAGHRKELGDCFAEWGYFWSDGKYSYNETEDLAVPVRWV